MLVDVEDRPDHLEVDRVFIVVETVEGDVTEIRAFGEKDSADAACERIEEKEPWKEVHREDFIIPAHLEDKREDYLAWMRSQMDDE